MPAQLKTALSAGVHALVALMVSVAIAHGIDIPVAWSAWAETAILAAGIAGYTWLTHWLATRQGATGFAPFARGLAKLLTLGAGALIPAPPPVPERVQQLRDAAAQRAATVGKHSAVTP